MPYERLADLPKPVRDALPKEAQDIWRRAYNSAEETYDNESQRAAVAWHAVRQAGWRKEGDRWVKKGGCRLYAYRCQICGHVYLGHMKGDRCPFCGSCSDFLVFAEDYLPADQAETLSLSEQTRNNLAGILDAAGQAEAYFRACQQKALSRYTESCFKGLANHHAIHRQVLARLLKVEIPELPKLPDAAESDTEKFIRAGDIEQKLLDQYKQALAVAEEPDVRIILETLADVVQQHKILVVKEALAEPYDEKQEPTSGDVHVPSTVWESSGDDIRREISIIADFIKADEEKRIVCGIVLEPDTIDTQGDIISAEEIERAAHNFLVKSRIVGEQHVKRAAADVVESYIAPVNMVIGEELVKKGSWVMSVKVHDEKLWQAIKEGDITGFSIGAYGLREPI